MNLFKNENFVSAAGLNLNYKIECDALTDEDLEAIAAIVAPQLKPFWCVVGVPTGGARMVKFFEKYRTLEWYGENFSALIVDDVWTTGKSLLEFKDREGWEGSKNWHGFVIFNRNVNPLPENIKSLMTVNF